MKSAFFRYLILSFLLLRAIALNGQESAIGRTFTFSFPQSVDGSYPSTISINMTSTDVSQRGFSTVRIPALNIEQSLEFDGSLIAWGQKLSGTDFMQLQEGKDDLVIFVESEVDVVLHTSSYYDAHPENHGDAALILPDNVLGTEYFVISHNEDSDLFGSEALIVATQDNTFIDIIPTADTREQQAGVKFTIELDRGERYQIQSKGDLTGTYIGLNPQLNTACAPIAVFGGSVKTTVGNRTKAGHMYKQLFPLSAWGLSYSLLPFEDAPGDYLIKAVALEDDTRISVNGANVPPVVNSGEVFTLTLNEAVKLEANKPIQVAQFFMGFTSGTERPDPFMTMPLANEHFSSRQNSFVPNFLVFNPDGQFEEYHTVIMRADEVNQFTHTLGTFQTNQTPFPPDPGFTYTTFIATNTFSQITTTGDPGYLLNLQVLGRADAVVNFGLKGNTGFVELDTLGIDIAPLVDDAEVVACSGEALNFSPTFYGQEVANPKYNTFEWDFGDGTTATGADVSHAFDEPGEYTIWLRASNSINLCAEEETASRTIRIVQASADAITGPASVCPNVEGVPYQAIAQDGGSLQYFWSAAGGTIREANGAEVVVDWGDSRPDAFLALVTQNELSCFSDTLRYPVKINEQLEPGIPLGNDELCFTDRLANVYQVPVTPGSVYTWQISGGAITAGQGTHQVTVDWNAPEPDGGPLVGTLEFTESSTTQTDVCDGDSPRLEVTIHPELRADFDVSAVSCYEGTDGAVAISPLGGLAPYSILWPDGSTLTSRNDLEAGTYELTITDALGCTFISEVQVNEPDELTAPIAITDVSCHDGNDGEAVLSISGGTAPYTTSWDDAPPINEAVSSGLDAGTHSVRITDANGCELVINFEVDQPDPLAAEVTSIPTCQGFSTGSLEVSVSGGVAPYTYRWSSDPVQVGDLATDLAAGSYDVTITDANGCTLTLTDQLVTERIPRVYVPNAFSPNGDPENEIFSAISDCPVNFQMQIYSKWGDLVFFSTDISSGWDGTINNEPAPLGVYTYLISYTLTLNGEPYTENLRGKVRIFR